MGRGERGSNAMVKVNITFITLFVVRSGLSNKVNDYINGYASRVANV